jgi:hypothetical protein
LAGYFKLALTKRAAPTPRIGSFNHDSGHVQTSPNPSTGGVFKHSDEYPMSISRNLGQMMEGFAYPLCRSYCSLQFTEPGSVSTGAAGTAPVSASEKNSDRNVKARLERKSPSEIQYQLSP